MSSLAQVKHGELILEHDGQEIGVIKTPYIASDLKITFDQIIDEARAAIYRYVAVPKNVLEPPHRSADWSRAEWEFSRHKIHCGTGYSRTPIEYVFPLASRDANENNLTNGNH